MRIPIDRDYNLPIAFPAPYNPEAIAPNQISAKIKTNRGQQPRK